MRLEAVSAVVTGAASGLGLATASELAARNASVVLVDLPGSDGPAAAKSIGRGARFVAADVTDARQLQEAVDAAVSEAPLRVLVNCAGIGGTVRVLDRNGAPGDIDTFERVVRVNLLGSFNALRICAAAMRTAEPADGERGVCVLTSSIAAYDGQIGQAAYASSKAGIGALGFVAARDLARVGIRVCTIAPGLMDTPLLARLDGDVRHVLEAGVPHPARLGRAEEFAALALAIVENGYLNGETIRLDGALRMAPR
jgi:NAD(P)-dependent dehydrogenase (short-subunit alcohol dehydrogenase family)